MDIGAQTLAQLSLENKEAKYITIEMGSKISGYTKEYLERLCRLNKVIYRIWNNGAFVIELESLLKETHTILLSYEGITFVDKSELSDPTEVIVPRILISGQGDIIKAGSKTESITEVKIEDENSYGVGSAQPLPRFGGSTFGSKSLAFVGRAVVSDPEHPGQDIAPKMSTPHAFVERQITMDEDLPKEAVKEVAVSAPEAEIKKAASAEIKIAPVPAAETVTQTPQAIHHSVHIPISPSSVEKPEVETQPETTPHAAIHIPIAPDKQARIIIPERPVEEAKKAALKADDWNSMLFGQEKVEEVKVETVEPAVLSKADVPSPYRPIKTSIDATEHHDDGMLFPPMKLDTLNTPQGDTSAVPQAGQKVVVFAPESFPGHSMQAHVDKSVEEKLITTPAEQMEAKAMEGIIRANPTIAQLAKIPKSDFSSGRTPGMPMKPATNSSLLPKEPLPLMRVMPQLPSDEKHALPMKAEEHHMLVHEAHPLMKSVGFNAAAVLIVVSSFALAGGMLTGDLGNKLNTASYVAGVGAAFSGDSGSPEGDTPLPTQALPPTENTNSVNMLPFSNDVVVTDGNKPNSVLVQPVFDDGAGKTYQFDIVPTDTSTTSNSSTE